MSRTIEEILENIDTATSDELAQIAENSTMEDTEGAKKDETAEIAVADPATSSDVTVKTNEDAKETEAPLQAPIQARDGKHIIPYEVLANTRAAKEAAELAKVELQAKLDVLQAQINAESNKQAEKSAKVSALSPEELEEMQENFPVMAKAYQAMQENLEQLQKANEAQQLVSHKAEANSVQDLIDANPKLAFLQSSDQIAWQRAVELDDQLRTNPATAHLPIAERFVKAAAAYEAIYGAINAPIVTTPATNKAVKTVDEVLAASKPSAPHSLSDLHGGSFVEANDIGNLENLSAMEIGNNMMKMTAKQRDAYLNSLG